MAIAIAMASLAQGATRSPYSQYGLGVLSDQSQGFNRGMNGVGLALRKGNIVNTLNPASFSAIDSLTFLFDVGLSGQITHFKEGSASVNSKNASFEYAVGSFRLMRNVGIGFGILPYSNIGYDHSSTSLLDIAGNSVTETYSGSGGLHQLFVGAGWRIVPQLSLGVNVGYIWGTYSKSVISSNGNNSVINSLAKTYSANINNYSVEVGAQWQQKMTNQDNLTLGATIGIGHKLGADAKCSILNINSLTSTCDTTVMVASNPLATPMTYGVGAAWNHSEKLIVETDVTLQKWGSLDFPAYDEARGTYAPTSGLLKDRYKVNAGMDYVPAPMSQKYFNRVHYRMGAGFSTPYCRINGSDGPKELSLSAGLGLPLQNGWNSRGNMRPVLNISAQWTHASAPGLITENTFRINIGLTFNERWFAKWKID